MVSPGTERTHAKKVAEKERGGKEQERERDVKYNEQNLTQGVRKNRLKINFMAFRPGYTSLDLGMRLYT